MSTICCFRAYIMINGAPPSGSHSFTEGTDFRIENTMLVADTADASQVQQDAMSSQYQTQYPGATWFEMIILN